MSLGSRICNILGELLFNGVRLCIAPQAINPLYNPCSFSILSHILRNGIVYYRSNAQAVFNCFHILRNVHH
jgi:hypothetical protein